jgi:hypothetical protein
VEAAELSRWHLKQSFDTSSSLLPPDGPVLLQLVQELVLLRALT